ncbi:MAG: hypothetical protein IRZ13_03800 [Acetobacteraceae bacterium]|nr:hypothetical protein [Acetobacteraceae bacterium]
MVAILCRWCSRRSSIRAAAARPVAPDEYAADRWFLRVIGLVLVAESMLIAWLLAG